MSERPDPSAASDQDGPVVHSLHRAMRLLRIVAAENASGVRLADAARRTGIARSTAHRLLQALERESLIEMNRATERYHLGADMMLMGMAAEQRFKLTDRLLPTVQKIATATGDTCLLQVRRGDYSVCLVREDGNFPIRTHTSHPGDRHPLGVGAGGLAMLAELDDREVADIIGRTTDELRARYRITPEEMFAHVEDTRRDGYAFNRGRVFPGSFGVGVTVSDRSGHVRASLALAGIETRIAPPRTDAIVAALKKAGAECAPLWTDGIEAHISSD